MIPTQQENLDLPSNHSTWIPTYTIKIEQYKKVLNTSYKHTRVCEAHP